MCISRLVSVCLLILTSVYWPRWCPGGRSSGTHCPAGCCRRSAWPSLAVLGHGQRLPLPAVSPPEDPDLVQDKEPLSDRDPSTASTPAKPKQLCPASAFTLALSVFQQIDTYVHICYIISLLWIVFACENMKKFINHSSQISLSSYKTQHSASKQMCLQDGNVWNSFALFYEAHNQRIYLSTMIVFVKTNLHKKKRKEKTPQWSYHLYWKLKGTVHLQSRPPWLWNNLSEEITLSESVKSLFKSYFNLWSWVLIFF